MIELTDLQRKALENISTHTAQRPVTGKEVAIQIGLKARATGKEGADMRSIIHALRVKGYPICATGRGYFYPANGDELKGYIDSLEARAREVQEAADGLKQGYSLVGQAKAQEAVKVSTVRTWRADGGIFRVRGDKEEAFLARYPKAELI